MSKTSVLTIIKRVIAAVFTVQFLTAVILMIVDSIRKHRNDLDVDVTRLTDGPISVGINGSQATLFTNGADLYDDMLREIEAAKEFIYLETFIWKADKIGKRFKDAVIAASKRGVKVFVGFDSFANLVVSSEFKKFPEHINVLQFPLYQAGIPSLRTLARNHRKLLVIDHTIGYVGGFNIGSLYRTQWRDTHIRFDGEAVWDLENAFIDFWNMYRNPSDPRQPEIADHGSGEWDPMIRTHRNLPGQLVFPIRNMYLEAIDRAVSHIYITQGYFIPDKDMTRRLLNATARGVKVVVLMPEWSNHVIADVIARRHFSTLLNHSVSIMLYQDAMVHSKTATIDSKWSTIGTANIDRLSLSGNYEINVEVVDENLAGAMEAMFARDLQNARELTLDEWNQRSMWAKISEAIVGPLRPFV